MKFDIPEDSNPIIKVIGVGGGGSNAVNYMYEKKIIGVDFAICNTDNQAMNLSEVLHKIQLGPTLTEGRGAGSKPGIGREYGTKMLFVTAGMGGGTGTGAAPVIAKAAQELDILTVGIVTVPFTFEGRRRMKQAMEGLAELKKNVDTLIVISNDKLRKIYGNLNLSEAFSKADDILMTAAKGIAEIITVPGYVNVDFEDVNTVMRDSGVAVMGTATTEGDDRALRAVEAALQSPLLEDNDIKGAKHILLNITSGTREVTMDEVFEITEFVQEEAGHGTDLIWGNCYDETLGDKLSVTVIATGFNRNLQEQEKRATTETPKVTSKQEKQVRVSLDDEVGTKDKKSFYFEDKKEVNNGIQEVIPTYLNENVEPFVKEEPAKEEKTVQQESLEERKKRLKNLSVKLDDPEVVNELENQPAYLRKGVKLEEVEHSSEKKLSKWMLSDEEEPEIKDSNSYLHDNVD